LRRINVVTKVKTIIKNLYENWINPTCEDDYIFGIILMLIGLKLLVEPLTFLPVSGGTTIPNPLPAWATIGLAYMRRLVPFMSATLVFLIGYRTFWQAWEDSREEEPEAE
jgi:hypothetical protein